MHNVLQQKTTKNKEQQRSFTQAIYDHKQPVQQSSFVLQLVAIDTDGYPISERKKCALWLFQVCIMVLGTGLSIAHETITNSGSLP